MHEDLSKEELAQKMREKVQASLAENGPEKLIIHNLENFAYRYLETSNNKEIKCSLDGNYFWVESIEPNILEALKWENPMVKKELIKLCKDYPGQRSKEIEIKLLLETKLDTRKITNRALINWDFPKFTSQEKQIEKTNSYSYEDFLQLRNKHAVWLEELTDLFL